MHHFFGFPKKFIKLLCPVAGDALLPDFFAGPDAVPVGLPVYVLAGCFGFGAGSVLNRCVPDSASVSERSEALFMTISSSPLEVAEALRDNFGFALGLAVDLAFDFAFDDG
jgi:hypothetical protein